MTYRKAFAEWINKMHIGWPWAMYQEGWPMERFVANATPEQRSIMGFLKPGQAYWTKQKIEGVTSCYGKLGFDPKPYIDTLKT